jgi:hypothetical protein
MRPGEWFADRFEIVAVAGRGAAGTVYRARDRFGAQVALKIVSARSDDRAADTSVGRAIERASSILRAAGEHTRPLVDATTASLLEARIPLRPTADGLAELMQLEPQSPALSATPGEGRPVLGRVPPFVGRDAEVAELIADAAWCIEAGPSRAVLLTGAPGSGKSRLVAAAQVETCSAPRR